MALSLPVLLVLASSLLAGENDWPMWRGNAARSRTSAGKLPDQLRLQWVRKLPPQVPAWKDEPGMAFDRDYQPIVLGSLLFVGSDTSDRLTAYDCESGAEKWRFYADGPIRFAPAGWKETVFVASDDGCLYALQAADGKLRWRFRPGPAARLLIGNERLISTWPVRGGPVVADDRVYCAAGVWPFMGTFICALDAETGRVVWESDETSFTYRSLPHPGASGFSGLSAQGYLVVAGDKLLVPGSRYEPALLDRRTGKFLGYATGGSPYAASSGRFVFSGGEAYDVESGSPVFLGDVVRGPLILDATAWYTPHGAYDPAGLALQEAAPRPTEKVDPGEVGEGPEMPNGRKALAGTLRKLWTKPGTPWLCAGGRLVVTEKNMLQILDVSDRSVPKLVCQLRYDFTPAAMLAGAGRLFVVTSEPSALYCYGDAEAEAQRFELPPPEKLEPGTWADRAAEMLRASGAGEGYAFVWGLKDGGLAEELARQSSLHIIAVDRDAEKVRALRAKWDAAGLYGSRLAALVCDPAELVLVPYVANLIATEDLDAAGWGRGTDFVRTLASALRPYGGAACLPVPGDKQGQLAQWTQEAQLAGYELKRAGAFALLKRAGALPGAADWCGQNADAGNTRCSRDQLVRTPLGILWFGNSLSNSLILPRHGEGPVEQIADGRLIIEGPDSLSAADVYTGRFLWTRAFPDLGKFYDSGKHQAGAHSIGANFFTVPGAVYVATQLTCQVLDPATGKTVKELRLPVRAGAKPSPWQFFLVYQDYLIAGAYPVFDENQPPFRRYSPTASRQLVVFDRRTGEVLWTRDAAQGFPHYGIAAGGGRIYCLDRVAEETIRSGGDAKAPPRLLALDARDGKVVWQTDKDDGAKLSYSEEHDVLLAGCAYQGATGKLLWDDEPAYFDMWHGKWGLMLRGETIISQGRRAYDLHTGKLRVWKDSQGQEHDWSFHRIMGCGPTAASMNLLTFRSADAGVFDLAGDGGTANLGGFRSGCTNNLIVADGVLAAPDYTRTCSCAYQNRSSLGLVHMPEVEYWAFGALPTPGRVGYNLGAPGEHKAPDGTLWRPSPFGPSPRWDHTRPVTFGPPAAQVFYRHSSRMKEGPGWSWVGASGVQGLRTAQVPLDGLDASKELLVRLYFAEPDAQQEGARVFSVALDGKEVLKDFDIFKEAGGARRTMVKEFREIHYTGPQDAPPSLALAFTPQKGEPLLSGVEVLEVEKPKPPEAPPQVEPPKDKTPETEKDEG